jgi:hypothetical protein
MVGRSFGLRFGYYFYHFMGAKARRAGWIPEGAPPGWPTVAFFSMGSASGHLLQFKVAECDEILLTAAQPTLNHGNQTT